MGVAADARPNPEILTGKPPPPTPSRLSRSAPTSVDEADDDLLDACGITDLDELAQRCMTARRLLGTPTARWTARCGRHQAGRGDQRVAASLDGAGPAFRLSLIHISEPTR